ncbi:hypothetical protein H5410_011273 [Solanum commersonii]|uniref:Bidirectional sugar transporter SWEET n=1 Tax=Solanum commersonii TaxID=4109 RepID=A0A9J6APP5_SOLCO|nr:hypothetical protein H5410_011273 [Solanum commersonii]
METLPFIIGIIGNIISVLMFLAPVGTFRRIVQNKSTEDFDSLPYICTLLNSSLWTYYGIIKPGSYLVSTVNGFGVIVETIYIALFLKFAHPKMRVSNNLINHIKNTGILAGILNVGILATILLLAQFILYGEMRINVIGFLSTCLNIIMYSSPLGVMKTVVRSKSVEFMPFLLSFFFFLNGGVWTLYALLVSDWFLGVPNGIGWFLGAAQLVIYVIYRSPNSSVEDLEHGDQTERLLPPSSTQHYSNIFSGLVFLSPVGTFNRIVKNGSTEDFDSLQYICTLLNSSLWTYYGIIKPGSYLVSTVNGFGVIVETIYIALFLKFAHPKRRTKTASLAGVLNVGILGTILLLGQLLLHGQMRINVIGFLTAGLTIIMYSSPFGVVKTVVTTKSVEYMPFFLSFFLFLNGGVWTLYALLVGDWFVGVSNGTGCFLGAVQLIIYVIYRNPNSSKQLEDQTECLLPHSSS